MLRSAQPAFVAEVEMTLFLSHSLVETVKNVLITIPVYMIFEMISKFFSCLFNLIVFLAFAFSILAIR